MDMLTILIDAVLFIILARIVFTLLRLVHRRELALAWQRDRTRRLAPIPVRIDAYSPGPRQLARYRARHDGGFRGA
jgi:hypothetical protein